MADRRWEMGKFEKRKAKSEAACGEAALPKGEDLRLSMDG